MAGLTRRSQSIVRCQSWVAGQLRFVNMWGWVGGAMLGRIYGWLVGVVVVALCAFVCVRGWVTRSVLVSGVGGWRWWWRVAEPTDQPATKQANQPLVAIVF